jgi:serine/threonine-protein kinase
VSEVLDRLAAAIADRYHIERELGQGGMATVYLAEDVRHHRLVALKVLRPDLAATLGPERFAREIEVAARLQHPHILGLLDSGEADGFFYYVMPYVEGETLRERLARTGELPVHESVRLLSEIAEALAVAHRNGVVHRDIKPENILLSGRHALVMDFGVAKAVTEASGRQQLTTAGIALGTPAYMAPEQATADPHLDGRVDIYALGIVGYEMLTGRPPFHGLNPQQTLAAHVTQSPPALGTLRSGLAPALEAALMKCLAKRPADRFQSADELATTLEPLATPSGGLTPTGTQPIAAVAPQARRWGRSVGIGAVLIAGIVLGLLLRGRGTERTLTLVKTTRLTSAAGLEILPAISPDGKFLAYTARATSMTGSRIYIQPVDGGRALSVTDSLRGNQSAPDWSPDGSRLVFVSEDEKGAAIEIMPPTGGSVRTVYQSAPSESGVGPPQAPRWSPDGHQIAFEKGDSVMVINQDGTGLHMVAALVDVHSLAWSPDGRWLAGVTNNSAFVYGGDGGFSFGNLAASSIFVVPAAGGSPRAASDSTTLNISPVWLRDGRGILYVSSSGGGRDVYQQDIGRNEAPRGPARRITTGLDAHTIALSHDGRRLVYSKYTRDVNIWMLPEVPGGTASIRNAIQITHGNQAIETVRVSPDGKWLVYDSDLNGNADIFVVSAQGGTPRQLTDNPADDLTPAWSPDGAEVAFHSFRNGNRDIFEVNADGTGLAEVTSSPHHERFAVWGTRNSLAFAQDSDITFVTYEVIRNGPGAPWGPPRRLALGVPTGTTPDHRFYIIGALGGKPALVASGGGTATPMLPEDLRLGGQGRIPANGLFYFVSIDSSGPYISVADLRRHTIRKAVVFDDQTTRNPFRSFDTDGSHFYFARGTHEADIWVADLEQH